MSIDLDSLDAMLTRLELTAIRARLDTLLDEAARKERNMREILAWMDRAETAHKDQRRTTMGLVGALAKAHANGTLDELTSPVGKAA